MTMTLKELFKEKAAPRISEKLDEVFFADRMDSLMEQCRSCTEQLLDQEGFVTPVMVFVQMKVLPKRALKLWQNGRLPALRPAIQLTDSMILRCIHVMKDVASLQQLPVRYMPFYDPRFDRNDPLRPILPFTLLQDQEMERALSLAITKPGHHR